MKKDYDQILLETPMLHTKRLWLRRFEENDLAAVLSYGSDAETLRYLRWSGVQSMDEARQSLDFLLRPGVYALARKENNRCIGCIDLRMDAENEKATFGYVLDRAYWGQGYMTEALSTVLYFAFTGLKVNRVESTHYAPNPASGRVMSKCGMMREGYGVQEVKVKGEFFDVVHYGITYEQWYAQNAEKLTT